ncbi:hypothetical protein BX070DRAFT_223024 [Coemansia spiralis]|nr:hypothetical protein BX070DRAFT_223024 [Coemansia spiralis]
MDEFTLLLAYCLFDIALFLYEIRFKKKLSTSKRQENYCKYNLIIINGLCIYFIACMQRIH